MFSYLYIIVKAVHSININININKKSAVALVVHHHVKPDDTPPTTNCLVPKATALFKICSFMKTLWLICILAYQIRLSPVLIARLYAISRFFYDKKTLPLMRGRYKRGS